MRYIIGNDLYGQDYLEHSGTKGMHWYERRYQYPDGSYTPLGRQHYGIGPPRQNREGITKYNSGKTKLEKNMLRLEQNSTRRVKHLSKVKSKHEAKGNRKKIERTEAKLEKARKELNEIIEQADAYYASDPEVQKTIAKGYKKIYDGGLLLGGALGGAVSGGISGYKAYKYAEKELNKLLDDTKPQTRITSKDKDANEDGYSDETEYEEERSLAELRNQLGLTIKRTRKYQNPDGSLTEAGRKKIYAGD